MSVHTRHDLERLGRFARARFSHALMSDTKWRKLFVAVDEAGLKPQRIEMKLIESDQIRQMRWPGVASMYAPLPWIDSAEFGPIELRSIEWLLVPLEFDETRGFHGVPPRKARQDIEPIGQLLSKLGQYPTEVSAEGLRIVGYK